MEWIMLLGGILIGGVVCAGIYLRFLKPNHEQTQAKVEQETATLRHETQVEVQELLEKAEKEIKEKRLESEKVVERQFEAVGEERRSLIQRQSNLDRQLKRLEQREQLLNKRQSKMDRQQNELEKIESERQAELQKIAQMTKEEAHQELLSITEAEARQDMARVMREVEERARETAEEKARRILATTMQRISSENVAEMTISTVALPNDEMKGRIIGRNGRNIRSFEQAAGVDVIVDDTPEAVTISCFDPVRREVARRALEKLILDGRIHPARIEKLLKDAQDEVNKIILEAGEQAVYEANVHGLHREIIRMMGRLQFRTSYGQNQLYHSVESSKIAAMLAAELGADVEAAKIGGLLHDLGKAMDHEQEGTHAKLGADFAARFKVLPVIVNAIASHHHEVEQESIEAIIVEIADAISGSRPGARRESLESFIKRVRTLEDIATSFNGVESAFALQAGREIRILVKPGTVDDLGAMKLSKDIAKTVEDSMQYPGQIQVTVIRETRAVSFAK